MTQPAIGQRHRRSPSGQFLPEDGDGCTLQWCSDYERSDQLRIQAVAGWFLMPREQGNTTNPIRCEFAEWTAGSFLYVTARLAFNIRRSGGDAGAIQFIGSSRIAIDVGAGFQQAARTGASLSAGLVAFPPPAGTFNIGNGTAAHAHLLGPFDAAPTVALAGLWSLTSGSHMATGVDAQSDLTGDARPAGVGLVCAEVAAECVTAAQPPELVTVPLVPPSFAA